MSNEAGTVAEKPVKKTKVAKGSQEAKDKMAKVQAARGTTTKDNDVLTFVKDIGAEEKKLAPQAAQILAIIKAAGKISRKDCVAAMNGVVTSKQPLERILGYYIPVLTKERGLVSVEPAVVPEVAKGA